MAYFPQKRTAVIRVSFFTTSFPKYPGDSHAPWILSMASDLVKKGCEVTVVAPSAHDLGVSDNYNGVHIKRFRYTLKMMEKVAYGANIPANVASSKVAKLNLPLFIFGFFLAAIRYLQKSDIIHAQFGYSGVFAALASGFVARKKPLIVSFYGRDVAHAEKYKGLYSYTIGKAKKILVLSDDMKNRLQELGYSKQKITKLHLGVNIEEFTSRSNIDKYSKLTFLIVANFVEKKGIEIGIRSFAKLVRNYPESQLIIVGQGPLEKDYRSITNQLGIGNSVDILNNYKSDKPRQFVLDQMQMAHVFMLPSITAKGDYGGTPIVLMEAGAMCLPSITTNNAGNTEIVRDGETGILVKENDEGDLYLAMLKLAQSKTMREEMGMHARSFVEKEFNHKTQMKKLFEIYENEING